MASSTVRATDGASPSSGSSSRISPGLAASARPMASICCWPPDSVRAGWRARSERIGNTSPIRSGCPVARLAPHGGQRQVLGHGQVGEHPPVLGDVGDARPGDAVRLPAGDVLAGKGDPAPLRRHHAHDRLERRAATGAVAAQQRGHFTFGHLEIDAVQRGALAVARPRALRSGGSFAPHPHEIGLLDLGVLPHLLGRAFGDDDAPVQH